MSIDLGKLVASALRTVDSTVAGSTRTITYRHASGARSYDPVTGTTTGTTTDYVVQAVFTAYSRKDKDANFQSAKRIPIEFGDVKCLIAYADLPITPSMEDVVIDGTAQWSVVEQGIDPTGRALHTFQLRQT